MDGMAAFFVCYSKHTHYFTGRFISNSLTTAPSPPKKKNTGFKVYQRISCKSFLYLGDNMYMRNSNDYHSHLKMAAKQKWYSKENGSLITLK